MRQSPLMVLATALLLLAGLHACQCGGGGGGNDGGPDGGFVVDASCANSFCVGALLPDNPATGPRELNPIAMALLPSDRVGVAYYERVGTDFENDGGVTDGGGVGVGLYEVRYLEWNAGSVTAPVTVDGPMKRVVGLAIAAQPNGEPAVAYLGGNDPPTVQSFWFQNDAYLAYRTPGGTWTREAVVRESNEAAGGGGPLSPFGFLVGLHPALVFDGDVAYLAYRDAHKGSFPQQDWNASDLEVAHGWNGSWDKRVAAAADGVTEGKLAYGGHNQIVMGAGGQPVIACDQIVGAADAPGQNVSFFMRRPDGTWTTPVVAVATPNTQLGPSLAYDSVEGYAVAVADRNSNKLLYASSPDGVTWPPTAEAVFQSGTGGWYPSLAFEPTYHDPEIAYYYCDGRTGINEGFCRDYQDELRITYRTPGGWQTHVVDLEGGWAPKLAFLSTGKRVLVYRDNRRGFIKIAVEE